MIKSKMKQTAKTSTTIYWSASGIRSKDERGRPQPPRYVSVLTNIWQRSGHNLFNLIIKRYNYDKKKSDKYYSRTG
jgi:hypothetical protein